MNQKDLLNSTKRFLTDPTLGILYGLITLIYQILYGLVPTRIAIQSSILSGFSPFLAVIGFGLLFMSLLTDPNRFKQKEMRISWLLILVLLLSTVVNHERGMKENIKTIIWQANLLLLVFSSWVKLGEKYSGNSEKGYFPEFACQAVRYTIRFLLVILGIAVIWSLALYFQLSYREILTYKDHYHFGLYEGRLFGVFTTPYNAALIYTYVMTASLFCILSPGVKRKAFPIVSCILSATMIVLTGTRSVLLGILLAVFIVAAMILTEKEPAAASGNRVFLARILAVFLALSMSVGVYLIQMGYGRALQQTAELLNGSSAEEMQSEDNLNGSNLKRKDQSNNIASNRFGIWEDYIHVLLDRPEKLILGYSPCGYMGYIDDNYPDLFIVQYYREKYSFYYLQNHDVYAAHNSVLTILISTGLAGLALLVALAVKTLKQIFVYYRRGKFRALDYCFLAMLITTATAMMFESDVFYQCNTSSVVFWMMIGFLSGRYKTDEQRAALGGLYCRLKMKESMGEQRGRRSP